MNGIESKACSQRLEDGNHDDGRRRGIHKAADAHHRQDHKKHYNIGVGGHARNQHAELIRKLQNRDTVAEYAGGRENQRALTDRKRGGLNGFNQIIKAEFLVIKYADDHTIQTGHSARLGGGEHAGEGSADDDQRHDHGGDGVLGSSQKASAIEGGPVVAIAVLRVPFGLGVTVKHLCSADQNARNHTRHKQFSTGNTGDGRVEHHQNGGRYDGTNGGGGAGNGRGIGTAVPGLGHSRDLHNAQRRHVG